MKIAKKQRRQFYRAMQRLRQETAERSPPWARRVFGPIVDYADMLLIDHGIFRVIYPNRHRLGVDAWRASQPAPHQIRSYARKGIRTIINLRGVRDCGSYRLEVAACKRHGIELVNFQLRSRALPDPPQIHEARKVLQDVEYPILIHCKSGADRVGLMSVFYKLMRENVPMEAAKGQLDWRYGHFRQADTGVLDHLCETYLAARNGHAAEQGSDCEAFLEWVDTDYEPERLRDEFRSRTWANAIVNAILRRE